MSIGVCTEGKNFGQPDCVGILERAEKLAFVKMTAEDGTANAILSTDTIDNTFVTDLINQTDKSKRWFPTPVTNKVNVERAEDNKFDLDGFQISVSEGVKTYSFVVVDGAHPLIAEAFKSFAKSTSGFWVWSVTGQIGGNNREEGKLLPFRIKKGTMSAIYQEPNKENETPAMVMVSFAISELENDKNIAFINPGTGANDVQVDITSYNGLINVTMGEATDITTAGFTSVMTYDYGSAFVGVPFKGGLVDDFTAAEISPSPAPEPLASVTETSDGVYDFVYTTPVASADLIRITGSKNGWDFVATLDVLTP